MKTKMMSILLVAAMLLSILPVFGVSATDTVEYIDIPSGQGWNVVYETTGASATRVANLAKNEASDETYSLHLTNNLNADGGAIHVKSTSFNEAAVTAGGDVKYELTIDVKNLWGKLADDTTDVVKYSDGLIAMIGWGYPDSDNSGNYDGDSPTADYTDGGVVKMKDGSSRTSLEGLENGWQRLTYVLDGGTAIAKGVQGFRIRVNSEIPGDIYIDNISLKKMENGAATGANLIQNGSFEDGITTYETEALNAEQWTISGTGTAEIAKGVAKTGERSLHVVNTKTPETSVKIDSKILTTSVVKEKFNPEADVAKVSFWLKGDYTLAEGADGSQLTVNIGWNWDATRLRFYVENPGETQRPMTQVETVDGWTKYEGTFDFSDFPTYTPNLSAFFFNFEKCDCDLFIDDVVVTVNGETTNLLGESGTFEIESAEPEIEHIDLDHWVTADCTPDGTTLLAATATGVSYSGNNSLHLKSDEGKIVTVRPYNTAGTTINVLKSKSDAYVLTFYMKGDYTDAADNMQVMMGFCYSDQVTSGNACAWKCCESVLDPQEPENAEKADEGWRKYSVTLYGDGLYNEDGTTTGKNSGALQFVFRNKAYDVFIDDVSLVKVGDTTNTNLIANPGLEGVTTTPDPDPEPDPEPEESAVMYTDFPSGSVWVPNYRAEAQSETRSVDIAIGEFYTGNSSLHITNDKESELSLPNTSFTHADIKEGVTYTLSFYIKNIDGISVNDALYAQIGWGGWVNKYGDVGGVVKVKDGAAMLRDTNTDKEGWVRVYTTFDGTTVKNATDTTGFRFNIVNGISDIYIDDVSLTASDDETNTNLLKESGFEIEAPSGGYLVDSIKIYDGETEINDLADASGKTLTIKTKAASFDIEKLNGAQLIVAVYDGYEMKTANMTEVVSFTKDGEVAELTTTIVMPTYTEVGDYSLRAFVWDSLTGGRALAKDKEI